MIDDRSVHGEDALDALAKADLADGDALSHALAIAGDDGAFKSLEAFFFAFLDLDVNLNGVAGTKLGEFLLPLVLRNEFSQQRVLHDNVRNPLVYNIPGCFWGRRALQDVRKQRISQR